MPYINRKDNSQTEEASLHLYIYIYIYYFFLICLTLILAILMSTYPYHLDLQPQTHAFYITHILICRFRLVTNAAVALSMQSSNFDFDQTRVLGIVSVQWQKKEMENQHTLTHACIVLIFVHCSCLSQLVSSTKYSSILQMCANLFT